MHRDQKSSFAVASLRDTSHRMRVILVIAFSLLLFTLGFGSAHAQPNISPRITVDGVECWVHTVKKSETLYAISRMYQVSQTEIAAKNPNIYYGIKKGQKLLIPIPESKKIRSEDSPEEYKIHIVQPGETLYSLAGKYRISVEGLRRYNQLASDTLRVSETLRIPRVEPEFPDETRPCIFHKVQKQESLYSIARQYNVAIGAIVEANPALEEKGLQFGETICIPTRKSSPTHNAEPQQGLQSQEQDDSPGKIVKPFVYCDSLKAFPRNRPIRVTLMLPFSIGMLPIDTDEDIQEKEESKIAERVKADNRFVDFYRGALIALEQFKLSGISVTLDVFDTKRSAEQIQKIVDSDTLRNADLIIGPVYPQGITIVSAYAAQNRITMVSPLSGKTPAFEMNPYLFQANPSFHTQLHSLIQQIHLPQNARLLLIREQAVLDAEMGENLHLMIESRLMSMGESGSVKYRTLMFPTAEIPPNITKRIGEELSSTDSNVVIIASNREPFITTVLGYLNGMKVRSPKNVTVYGMQRWTKLTNLDFSQLLNLRVKIFSPFHVDYTNPRVCSFVRNYRETFAAEPSQFGFQGYDIFVYFLRAIYKYGMDFRYCIEKLENMQLQNRFQFKQSQDFSSYENEGVFILQYDLEEGLVPIEKIAPKEALSIP